MADDKMKRMRELLPDMTSGFGGLFTKVMKDGAISLREKELIALAIGVAARCTPCIRMHIQKCLDAGASKDQILEAASVAVLMGGGPAYMYIQEVIAALEG